MSTVSTYGWIIDKDFEPTEGAPPATNDNAAGMYGPHNIPAVLFGGLKAGLGERFRMRYDEEGPEGLAYEGRIVGDYEGFEPLDDFGNGNAGCTEIQYLENGKWVTL